jgi:3-phosphoshikimate 1-carboxyvinyltransferase
VLSLTMRGRVAITNLNRGAAVSVLLPALAALGARISEFSEGVLIEMPSDGSIMQPTVPLDLGASSAAARFLIGLLTGLGVRAEVYGNERLRNQPMEWIVEPLRTLGARLSYLGEDARLPVLIEQGRINNGVVRLSVGSAQASTAVMLAAYAARASVRILAKVRSRDHTVRLLRQLGSDVIETVDGYEVRGRPPIGLSEYTVPGDPSAAACLSAAHVLSQSDYSLFIKDVCINPTRIGFFRLLTTCGVQVAYERTRDYCGEPVADVVIPPGPYKLRPFEIRDEDELHAMIDEVPLAAALATRIPARSIIDRAGELRFKETNRLATTSEMLRSFGASTRVDGDSIIVDGGNTLTVARASSFADHRIAMAASALACSIPGESKVLAGACVENSFPDFVQHMREAGFQVSY